MFQNFRPPRLPEPGADYDVVYMRKLMDTLRLLLQQMFAVQPIGISALNINTDTLPTEADIATLRVGDVYRDTTADNALKVKV
jgi:hypothetical protein